MVGTSETQRCDKSCALAQGDILSFLGERDDGSHVDYGVVINADCDIENQKTDGIISFLPMYPIRSYLNRFWAPKHVAALAADSIKQVQTCCGLTVQEAADLRQWLLNADASEVASALARDLKLKRSAEDTMREAVRRASIYLSDEEPLKKIALTSKADANGKRQLTKQILAGRQAIGESGFFISEVHGADTLGYVIRLTRVLSIPLGHCFLDKPQRLASGLIPRAGARISRLTPAYKYRVAQLFANQYSRIGLPNDLMALDAIAIEELADRLEWEVS